VSGSLLPAIKRSSEDASLIMNLLLRISQEEGIPEYVFKALLTLSKKHLRLQSSHLPTSAQHFQQLVEILYRCSKLNLWAEVESFVTVFSAEVSTANAITLQSLHIPFLGFLARAFETHRSSLNSPILQTLYRNTLSSFISKSSLPPEPKPPCNLEALAGCGCGCAPCREMDSFLIDPRQTSRYLEKRVKQRRHLEERLQNYIRTRFIRASLDKRGRAREPYLLRLEKLSPRHYAAVLAWQRNRDQITRLIYDIGTPALRILLGEDFATITSLRPISPKRLVGAKQNTKPPLPACFSKSVPQVVDLTMDDDDDQLESLPDFDPSLPTLGSTTKGPATCTSTFHAPEGPYPLTESRPTGSAALGSNETRTLTPLGPASSSSMNHNFEGAGDVLKRKSEGDGDENPGIELKRHRFDDPSPKNGVERQAGENLPSVLGTDVPPLPNYGSGF
jgi:hypothetical protein